VGAYRREEPHERRREFVTLLGGTAATWPLAARAQSGREEIHGRLSQRGLELAAVDGNGGLRQQAHLAAQLDEPRTNLLDGGAVVFAEIGDGFVIRNEPSRQPHHFQIAASLTLQPPARLDSVEIAVDVKLEHRRRMIRGPAGRCRIDAIEPEVAEFQRIDEHIDRANRIALADPTSRHSGNSVV
jgi:hypothetical protein